MATNRKAAKRRHLFRVRDGFHVSKRAAENVGPVIVALAESGAPDVPRALVEAARNPKSPAHPFFDWDDTKAAERWRTKQAQDYTRAIVYEVIVHRTKTKTIRGEMRVAYPIRDATGKTRHVSGGSVVRDVDMMGQLTARALAGLEQWREQWENLRKVGKLSGVFKAIDDVVPKETKRVA